jgi:hypothetical protein
MEQEPMKPLDAQRFERAVICLALNKAKYKVLEQIRSENLKLSQFTCREINEKRHQYFEANMETLISQALIDVWRLPTFSRYQPKEQHYVPDLPN